MKILKMWKLLKYMFHLNKKDKDTGYWKYKRSKINLKMMMEKDLE